MEITAAAAEEYERIRLFYHGLIERKAGSRFDIGWKKDIYLSPGFLRASIENGELFIGLLGEELAAVMVLNHQCNDGYRDFAWPAELPDGEVTVIHALAVHPDHEGKGYAKQLVCKAIALAGEKGQKAIRLDVLGGNTPARSLYRRLGFRYMGTVDMFYEDTGWADYELYEYAL